MEGIPNGKDVEEKKEGISPEGTSGRNAAYDEKSIKVLGGLYYTFNENQ